MLLTGIGHEINVLGSGGDGGDDDEYVLLMRSCIKWAHSIITIRIIFFLLQFGIHPVAVDLTLIQGKTIT
jgi:hypothetical protein